MDPKRQKLDKQVSTYFPDHKCGRHDSYTGNPKFKIQEISGTVERNKSHPVKKGRV